MIEVRTAESRGRTSVGWLDSRHTFSFGDYYDPGHSGYRALRVLNEDRVRGGGGFPAHAHHDMEIVSYVIDGALEHRDSSGGGGILRPGEIQLMRAGTGITHSEFNHSKTEAVHFLQIWIVPSSRGLAPGYAQRRFDRETAARSPLLLASGDGRDGALEIAQDVDLWVAIVGKGEARELALRPQRHAWVQVARGSVDVAGTRLDQGDGAAVRDETSVSLAGRDAAEVLVIDLA
jgi:redox-sensitive bicupin YhaK (pirin superfamily)